ncbi:MAG TPA: hypothetical protein VJP86_12840 [Vicinamibacterales bacterium]|nr:hypothetical protein [Vicinamibacterales bacterium]
MIDIIGDIIFYALFDGLRLGPNSTRNKFVVGGTIGVFLSLAIVRLVVLYPDPAREPDWGFSLLLAGAFYGTAAVSLAFLQLAKRRALVSATYCLLANVAPVAIPVSIAMS